MTKEPKNKNKKPSFNYRAIIFGLIVFVLALTVSVVSYGYAYRNQVLLNSYLQDKNISSKNSEELKSIIDKIDQEYADKKIVVTYGDKRWEMSFEDMAWNLDRDATAGEVLAYGHDSSWHKYLDLLNSLVKKRSFGLKYTFNEAIVLDWINGINSEIGQPKQETNIIVKKGEAKIIDSTVGKKINDDYIKGAILKRLALSEKGDIKAELIEDASVISHSEAEGLVEKAKQLTANEVEIVGPKQSIKLGQDQLGSMIKLKKKEKRSFFKTELGDAYVSFDDDKVRSLLQDNLTNLNIAAADAVFAISDGQITLTSPSKSGQEIKMDESISTILSDLERGEQKINLPSRVQEPSISAQTSDDIKKIGIKELIGTATTDFRKSSTSRVHNIETGVKYISGAIIKPGEEFSTIKRLGTIDQSGGYLPELVIKENETIPEYGGGLCQVSTTLFRAAMQSGLKITERQNHSYRVSYYEPPVGMDATIYSPKPDFKFVNDTDAYILLYGHVEGTKITFDIYGTKDGREVEVTDPTVYDITDPPEPIYTDDPSLEPGEIKQTDKAHPGAKAVFYYRVKKGGKLVSEDKFVSTYVSWPAKYLRGPQAESSATPQP